MQCPVVPGIFFLVLRRAQQRVRSIHTEKIAVCCRKCLAQILKPKWCKPGCIIMANHINKAGAGMAMYCRFRNNKRVPKFCILITDFTKVLYINVRGEYINMRGAVFPDFHHPRNRSAAWIHACFLPLIEPRIHHQRQIVLLLSRRCNTVYIFCHRICLKYLFRCQSKHIFPRPGFFSGLNCSSDLWIHFSNILSHILCKFRWNLFSEKFFCIIRMLPCCPLQS